MAEKEIKALLRAGIQAAKAGDRTKARRHFEQVLEQDDGNELAWMWMASVIRDPAERRVCLENVLDINPNNERAQHALARLEGRVKTQTQLRAEAAARARRGDALAWDSPDWEARLDAALPESQRQRQRQRRPEPQAAVAPERPRPARPGRRTVTLALMTLGILAVVIVAAALIALIGDDGQSGGASNPPAGGAAPTSTARVVSIDESTLPTLPPTYTPSPTQPPAPTRTPPPTPLPLSYYTLAVSARGPGQRTESIFRMLANGSGEMVQLTDDEGTDLYPAVSPDGMEVIFVSDRAGGLELFTVGIEGNAPPRQLTSLGATLLESPCWSPDGAHIVFNAEFDTSPDSEIYVIVRDRPNELTQLTDNLIDDRDPAWSPNGNTIVFTSDRDTLGYPQIYAVPADCQETYGRCEDQATLLERSQNASTAPAWSPDGQYIAFASNRKRIDDYNIYVMRANGSDVRLLTLDTYGGDQGHDVNPAWSPDGQWIAYMSDRIVGRFQIYVMSSDGSGARAVTSVVGDATSPAWLP